MTVEGTLFGLNASLKTVVLTLLAPLLIFTTSVDGLIAGLVRARVPYKLAFILGDAAFFPMLLVDVRSIIDAQRMRAGGRAHVPARPHPCHARLAVPLILGRDDQSQQLKLCCRLAFSGSRDRTYLHDVRMQFIDYLLIVISLVFLVGGGPVLHARLGTVHRPAIRTGSAAHPCRGWVGSASRLMPSSRRWARRRSTSPGKRF